MPEKTLAAKSGLDHGQHRDATSKRTRGFDSDAWLDMLTRLGQSNYKLSGALARDSRFGAPRLNSRRFFGAALRSELERERSRIARDLHAGAGQPLAGIRMNLEMLEGTGNELPPGTRNVIGRLQTLADEALAQVRSVSHRLHPPAWQGLSIADALKNLVESSGLRDRLEVSLRVELIGEPDWESKVALYRCTQECISNLARHSGATRVAICVLQIGNWIELEVADNGHGFAVERRKGPGIGLVALEEHASALGGRARISSNPGGTTVLVTIPFSPDSFDRDSSGQD